MSATWGEIVERSLSVADHGRPLTIPFQCLDQAVPDEFREMGVFDPVRALDRVLRGKDLYVDRNDDVVVVIRLPE
jgi:hypothetical protein